MIEAVIITASDGANIAGRYASVTSARGFALLLHMMPATKESYGTFQEKLAAAGLASLAIDFRGHGESSGGPDGYRNFTDSEHQQKRLDVEAAVRWMESRGATPERFFIVGASIGANLAIEYAAAHPAMRAVLALSPGLNYRGVLAMPSARGLLRTQRLYLAASRDDAESDAAVDKLAEVSLAKTQVRHFDHSGHGTAMLERDPLFADELIDWIRSVITAPTLRRGAGIS